MIGKNMDRTPSFSTMDVCTVLPNENVLVVGSSLSEFEKSSALFNVKEKNTWISLEESNHSRFGASLVRLGNRLFAISGFGLEVIIEEFIPDNNSWITVDSKLMSPKNLYRSTLAVPSRLFAHIKGGCEGIM